MRSYALMGFIVVGMALAGCGGKDDHQDLTEYTCADGTVLTAEQQEAFADHHNATYNPADHCPKPTTPTKPTPTPSKPNELPKLKLAILDAEGNATNVGLLVSSGTTAPAPVNLTFSAAGSTDDGAIQQIAIVVNDGNQTRVASLFSKGKFTSQTMAFDHPGVVNITVSAIDDRAGIATLAANAYINEQSVKTKNFSAALPESVAAADTCDGLISGSDPVEPAYYDDPNFEIGAGAQFITAKVTDGNAQIAICGPGKTALSDAGTDEVSTTPGAALPPGTTQDGYFVATYSIVGVPPGVPTNNVAVTVTVHYEPAAPAA